MFGRPRCREWTPLATQQLRLRTLIQIVGYNIRPPEHCMFPCSFYLTLHHTTMSAPFYTSERISSPHPKWKEIDSEITQRMSSTNVVIRIWCHIAYPDGSQPQDTVIQTWGVYLSGLRYIGANLASNFNSDCFKSNTLVFQMLGGYFCSYKSLKLDIIPDNEQEHGSLSSDSSGRTNLSKITFDSRMIMHQKAVSTSPKYKIDKEYSKSHSPNERGQNFATIRNSSSLNINYRRHDEEKCDPNFENSPDNLDIKEFTTSDIVCDSKNISQEDLFENTIDLSETAENYDLRNDSQGVPKYRYLALAFLKSEIRPSYNKTKLLQLHLLQYSIKKKQEAVQDIKERIYKKSALNDCLVADDEARLKCKRSQRNLFSPDDSEPSKDISSLQTDLSGKNGRLKEDRPIVSNGPRLKLKLNDLLSFKAKPSPYQLSEHIRLTKQLEILRFKRILLSDERDSKLTNIRRLKERHAKLVEENQDVGTELMQNYHSLSRYAEEARDSRRAAAATRDRAAAIHNALAERRNALLADVQHVFYIQRIETSTWTICDVPFPISGDDFTRSSPISESVAAGFVAQATCLAAAILNQPLRYKITLLGSASKILDITPDLPDPDIPLYPRGGDVTLFRYAVFLLNKCVSQLCCARALPVTDIRPTLRNLRRLLTHTPMGSDTSKLYGTYKWLTEPQCPRTQSLRSLMASDRGKYRQFNRFKDAVEGQTPQCPVSLRHRHSRSVGSYHDDQDMPTLDTSTTSIMGSESNIYNMKLAQNDSAEIKSNIKMHNSESDIMRMGDEKVIFTLGDDTTLIDLESKLVRLSSNNDDEITCATCLDDNVKRICSEITDFCSKDVHEGFDVAKYMENKREGASEIEELGKSCANCESERDGDCQLACANKVTDVIVIPSAEASLDIGRSERDRENDVNCERDRDDGSQLACANKVTDVIVIPSAEASLVIGRSERDRENDVNCEKDRDSANQSIYINDVKDVIVIPSAEAILDTGQSERDRRINNDVNATVNCESGRDGDSQSVCANNGTEVIVIPNAIFDSSRSERYCDS